jgi:sec-independent protein translocase protein TatC
MSLRDDNHLDSPAMSLGEHIEELRKRLVYSIIGIAITTTFCFFFASKIIAYLLLPYQQSMKKLNLEPHLQTLAPADGFMTYMKIATWAGLVIASPWIFYHLWKFVSAGLYWKEKRYVYFAVPISAILFILGTLFAALFIAPYTITFFVEFNRKVLGIDSAFTFQNYISFMVNTMVVFGICFQTPVAMFFLNKIGLVSLTVLKKSRRYVIFIVTLIAGLFSPGADAISLLAMAVPLYLLYEVGMVVITLAGKKDVPEESAVTISED